MRRRTRDEGFRAFFAAEAESLQRFATFMCGDVDRAADLTQEALLRTYRNWSRIKGTEPGPYARRIIVNQVRDDHRYTQARRARPPEPQPPVPSSTPRVDDRLEMTEALRSLSPIRRATIVLRFYEDFSEAQIAQLLDRPLGSVKSDIHRALSQLKPFFEREQVRDKA